MSRTTKSWRDYPSYDRIRWAGQALTDRQLNVLRLVAHGYTNDAIAARLGVSGDTVKRHLRSAYARLGARNAPHAIALAHQEGWLVTTPGTSDIKSDVESRVSSNGAVYVTPNVSVRSMSQVVEQRTLTANEQELFTEIQRSQARTGALWRKIGRRISDPNPHEMFVAKHYLLAGYAALLSIVATTQDPFGAPDDDATGDDNDNEIIDELAEPSHDTEE